MPTSNLIFRYALTIYQSHKNKLASYIVELNFNYVYILYIYIYIYIHTHTHTAFERYNFVNFAIKF